MLRGVFFDLYGTLLLYGDMDRAWDSWLTALHQALAEQGSTLDREQLRRACDGLFSGPEPPPVDGITLYERRLVELGKKFRLELDAPALASIAVRTIEAWQVQVKLDPETLPLLDWLRPRFRTALVTNFDHPPHVDRLLRRLDLDSCFDSIVVSGAVGTRKPDPAIFDTALEATGLAPAEIAYVGDAPEDVAAARSAGMRPICIRREGAADPTIVVDYRADISNRAGADEPEDTVVIRGLEEVRDLIRRWEQSGR
jgi:HAD superfamily hydrolase (TIGR01509 family)